MVAETSRRHPPLHISKLLLLFSLIALLLAACQAKGEKPIDSKRICALYAVDALTPREASAQLGLTEPMTAEEWWSGGWPARNLDIYKYCEFFNN